MAYRLFDLNPVYWNLLVTAPCDGGYLYFYDQGTTTPRNTWSDQDLTIPNTNPVILDSTGRANVNIWMDGAYTVVLKQADNVTVWTRDIDSSVSAALQIPTPLINGNFLTNDGTNLLWGAVLQPPDPTGSNGKYLTTDGTALLWNEITIPTVPITTSSNSLKASNILIQWGSDTAPASGARQTSKSSTFGTAYDSTPMVIVQPTNIATNGLQIAVPAVTSKSVSGFTVQFDSDDFSQTNAQFTSAVTYDWFAIGVKA